MVILITMKKMGANILDSKNGRIEFRVFAFNKKKVELLLKNAEKETTALMYEETPHIYSTVLENTGQDLLYKFRIEDEGDFPDPYSHFQPEGVHGFSRVIDHKKYRWNDYDWHGKDLSQLILYELHVGAFSPEGTFRSVAGKLDYLVELGINAIELMPVTQTPGRWNWGYDGATLFSVNKNYGTPDDLKYLIDRCHRKGIAVILDVVYNHLGPEGNYLPVYGPYFTFKHTTPWGAAVNFDDQYCEYMRAMVVDNVRYWLEEYHFDGLRLDAVHAIKDESLTHILQEIRAMTQKTAAEFNRKIALIAETDDNNVKIINPPEKGGYGLDAQWMDDFHHTIHTILTGEKRGYYIDYGRLEDLPKVYKNYLYTGEFSQFWQKDRGSDASQNPGYQFVVSIQNHDQVGNRAGGERLSNLVDFPSLKLVAGLLFFSPYIPLLFMGEEYAEKKPFLFFTDYGDPQLKAAVSQGRKEEFKAFGWKNFHDPEDDQTFYSSRLTPRDDWEEHNKQMFTFYRDLLGLRKSHPALSNLVKENTEVKVDSDTKLVEIQRWHGSIKLTGLFNLGENDFPLDAYQGKQIFNSQWKKYGGNVEGNSNILEKRSMIITEASKY
jgi:maltooligosyltrehalose trehalohydrolase